MSWADRKWLVGIYPLVSNNLSSIVGIWSSDDHKSNAIRFLFGKVLVLGSGSFDVLAFALIHFLAPPGRSADPVEEVASARS